MLVNRPIKQTHFEWMNVLDTKTGVVEDKAGMYIELFLCGVHCYMQLDTAYGDTCITDEFLTDHQVFSDLEVDSKVRYVGKDGKHLKEVPLALTSGADITIKRCYIEELKTKEQTKHRKEILNRDLPFAGYLGFDFFEGKSFAIDFPNQQLMWFENGLGLEKPSKFFLSRGMIIIPVQLNGKEIYALFDTATANSLLSVTNELHEAFFNIKRNELECMVEYRPDFAIETYYGTFPCELAFNAVYKNEPLQIETAGDYFNKYAYNNAFGSNAIIGNYLLRDYCVAFDMTDNTYQVQ